jgi:hypothetical protein
VDNTLVALTMAVLAVAVTEELQTQALSLVSMEQVAVLAVLLGPETSERTRLAVLALLLLGIQWEQ